MDISKIWDEVVSELAKHIDEHEIKTWIVPLSIIELRGDVVTLSAPNRFYKSWVDDRYLSAIRTVFNKDLSIDADVQIVIGNGKKQKHAPSLVSSDAPHVIEPRTMASSHLNKQYTFDTFVAGSSNQFAHATCLAVADGYFHTYNPLFIYGGVGLGKTHLMHAVGNRLMEKFPKLRVLYIPSEPFTNDMLQHLRLKKMEEFKAKYRTVDVLLFDDVQFIVGKERTMEEFFHTFNSLYDSQKQIIITSDRMPDEFPDMEDRIRSRFSWGLMADIQPPSTEEKVAILLKHAEIMNLPLPNDVAMYIAEHIKGDNVRELMGALIRLSAFASFNKKPVSISMAETSLDRMLVKTNRVITSDEIIAAVTGYFNVKLADLASKKRAKSVSLPRQIGMYFLRTKLELSLAEIGNLFGGRDHSTVLHACRTIENRMNEDPEIQEIINTVERNIYHR